MRCDLANASRPDLPARIVGEEAAGVVDRPRRRTRRRRAAAASAARSPLRPARRPAAALARPRRRRFVRHDDDRPARQADLRGDRRQPAAVRAADLRDAIAQLHAGHAGEQRVSACPAVEKSSMNSDDIVFRSCLNLLKLLPLRGKLGILLVGLGAVSTTTIAGVFAIRKGLAKPIGSLTQMGTLRLGKRTEGRSPKISEVVPLAGLDDLVFGGWDIFEDDCYAAAKTAGVLEPALLEQLRPELEQIRPWPAVFDQRYVKRLDGPNVKKGKNKKDLAEQVVADIRKFKADNNLDRMVMVWCGSTEIFATESPAHASIAAFEAALEQNDPAIPSSMIYAYAAIREGIPYANAAPNLTADIPALVELAAKTQVAAGRQGSQDRADADQDDHRARPEGAAARRRGLVFDQHPRQPRRRGARRSGVVQDQGREQEVGARLHPAAAALSRPLRGSLPRRPHQLLPAARRQQGRLGQHRSGRLARLPDAAQDQLPLPRQHPRRADRARRRAVPGPGEARRHARHPGVAVVLLQEPGPRARPLPRARPVHSADEAEEHAAVLRRAKS